MTSAEQLFHGNSLKTNTTASNLDASSSANRLNVGDVSAQFNLEFYNTMSRRPDHLHGFYGKQSQLVHSIEGDLEAPICTTLETIHARILAMGYQGARIVVESIDAQASLNGGIFILTTGNMKLKNGATKRFVQSFFLAEQPSGYYILNDCFRFVDGAAAVAPSKSEVPAAAPTRKDAEPAPVPTAAPAKPLTEEKPKEASPAKEKKPEPPREQPAPAKSVTVEKLREAAPAPPREQPAKKADTPVNTVPSSWASLAAGRTELWQDGVVTKASAAAPAADKSKDASVRRDQREQRPAAAKPSGDRRPPRSEPGRDGRPARPDGEKDYSRSVFVGNVGPNANSAELRKVLEIAGTITKFDFSAAKGHAFVEYETAQMASAATNGKYQINGHTMNVEARRPQAQRSSNPPSRRD